MTKFLLVAFAFIATSISAQVHDTAFVNVSDYSKNFIHDMRYATEDNFLKAKVYACDRCYLRLSTVKALMRAEKEFAKKGYRIKLYDCYRPVSVQRKMWEIVSDPNYVADPKKGSIHNRGGAVDITLVDSTGNELEMGTGFDHFGPEAAHRSTAVSSAARKNRKYLKKVMQRAGFRHFESEWWHYNLEGAAKFPLADFRWKCD